MFGRKRREAFRDLDDAGEEALLQQLYEEAQGPNGRYPSFKQMLRLSEERRDRLTAMLGDSEEASVDSGPSSAAPSSPAPTRRFPEDEGPTLTDWADLDSIRAEWPHEKFESQDRLGYDNGIRLSGDPGMPPRQRLNYAEYITRGLRHALYDDDLIARDEAAVGARTILHVLEPAPEPDSAIGLYIRRRSVRLALALTKIHQWQPPGLGGDGTVWFDAASPIVVDAIRYGPVPDTEAVQRFFGALAP